MSPFTCGLQTSRSVQALLVPGKGIQLALLVSNLMLLKLVAFCISMRCAQTSFELRPLLHLVHFYL